MITSTAPAHDSTLALSYGQFSDYEKHLRITQLAQQTGVCEHIISSGVRIWAHRGFAQALTIVARQIAIDKALRA